MPPKPLFASARVQRVAVAAVMAVLFAISMAAAYVLSAASATVQTIHVGGLDMELPATWTRDAEMEKSMTQRTQAKALASYADPNHPTRRLTVIRAKLDTSANLALKHAIEMLIPAPALGSLDHITPMAQIVALRTLHGLKYIGFGRSPSGDTADGYYIAVLTFDLKTYWMVVMTDDDVSAGDMNAAIQTDNQIFDQILLSARIDATNQRSNGESP